MIIGNMILYEIQNARKIRYPDVIRSIARL